MKSTLSYRRRSSGIALLIVLAVIALVVILLLAFLVTMTSDRLTTASYSQSIKAQEIGLGALEEITSDLKQEIAAGSQKTANSAAPLTETFSYTDPVTGLPINAYIPATSTSARPARIGYPSADYGLDVDSTGTLLPPTLVRVSRDSSDTFYQSPSSSAYPQFWAALPPARATTTSTTITSANGRTIATSRWNKPAILSATTTPSDFSNTPPEWVYVGRSGSLNTATGVAFADTDVPNGSLTADAAGNNPNAIVGRYAYAVYDEGALLDANVAGADLTTTGTITSSPLSPFRNKSYLSYADLTQIPGLTGTAGQTLLTSLVNWRNQGGLAAYGSYTALVSGTVTATGTYTGANVLGFLSGFGPHNSGTSATYPTPFTAASNKNDNPFLSRQDLIDYCNNVIGSTSPLPYLGTFTRAVNAPTASPYTVGTYNYAKYAENTSTTLPASTFGTPGTPNRDLANVRFSSTGTGTITITHYKDDGTPTTYTVDPGSPLLQRRFSLAKIAWIGYNGPNTAAFNPTLTGTQEANAIQDCFGLVWDTSPDPSNANLPYNTWDYVGCTTDGYSITSPPNVINTLAQVAALSTPREPNFFELLKAGILNGSIGRDPGPVAPSSTTTGVTGALFDSYSALPDAHLIQIGANIIDQATQDGYPTAIYFAQHNPATYTAKYYRLFDTAFGIKDLPYIYRIFPQQYTTSLTGNTTFPNTIGTCQAWYQPELWNPHQQPSTGTTPTTRPSAFRVRAHGGAEFAWHQLADTKPDHYVAGDDKGDPTDPLATINYESTTSGTANYTSANPSNPAAPSCVYFSDPNGNVFREQPLMLTTSNANVGTGANQAPNNQLPSGFTPDTVNSVGANTLVGLWVGSDPNYDPNLADKANAISHVCMYNATVPVPSGTPSYPTLAMEYADPSGNYHPYALFSRFILQLGSNSTNSTGTSDGLSTWCTPNTGVPLHMDPRTDRFSGSNGGPDATSAGINTKAPNWTYANTQTTSLYSGSTGGTQINPPIPSGASSYFFYSNSGTLTSGSSPTTPDYLNTWIQNQTATQNAAQSIGFITASGTTNYSYYLDPDQTPTLGITKDVPRPGDGFRWSKASSTNYNGIMLFHTSTATPAGYGNDEAPQRPVILNRPFRSVGELGYAFRDVPFKSIDFWSQYSADAALLDLFSVADEPAVVAGQFNPNNATVPVLEAVLSGGALKEIDPTVNYTPAELKAVATAVATYISSNGPLRNRQDLVTAGSGLYTSSPSTKTDLSDKIYTALTGASSNSYWGNKAYGEAPVRALAGVANMRTWNLMIDVIAQSGHMSSNPTASSTLGNAFVVDGEKRYWLHIAIDRYTGKVIDEQLEPVYE